jgi:hypothetical protein
MRFLLTLALAVCVTAEAPCQDAASTTNQRLAEALLELHEVGRTLYNDGDYAGGYRIYQGGLMAARRMLADRPDLQKLISDGMAVADRQPAVDRRAFRLHELIETLRVELARPTKAAEHLTVPPRTVAPGTKPETKPDTKPSAKVGEVKDGVVGRVIWQGQPLVGVDVAFVTLGQRPPRVYETTTGPQGGYAIAGLPPGRYVILITAGPKAAVKKLPDRYATSTTSPLTFEVKAAGEKLDFMLQ